MLQGTGTKDYDGEGQPRAPNRELSGACGGDGRLDHWVRTSLVES